MLFIEKEAMIATKINVAKGTPLADLYKKIAEGNMTREEALAVDNEIEKLVKTKKISKALYHFVCQLDEEGRLSYRDCRELLKTMNNDATTLGFAQILKECVQTKKDLQWG